MGDIMNWQIKYPYNQKNKDPKIQNQLYKNIYNPRFLDI